MSEAEGKPKPGTQRNFTDPESCIMVKDGAFVQASNAQAVVDEANQVIIAQGVSNQPPDQEYLVPMVERMLENCKQKPGALLADSGYFSSDNIEHLRERTIEAYIAGGRDRAPEVTPAEASSEVQRLKAMMAEKLRSAEGTATYARREVIVEPVFGRIKQARGFRRFSQRGRAKVGCEWAFVCPAHNLLKLLRFGQTGILAAGPPPALQTG